MYFAQSLTWSVWSGTRALRLGVALKTRRETFTPDGPYNVYIFRNSFQNTSLRRMLAWVS